MGHRHITKNEFVYIKDLLKKYKSASKVAKIAGRSKVTIFKIAPYETFVSYRGKRAPMSIKPINYGNTDVLKELASIRKGILAVNHELKKQALKKVVDSGSFLPGCEPVVNIRDRSRVLVTDENQTTSHFSEDYKPENDKMLKDFYKDDSMTVKDYFVLLFVSILVCGGVFYLAR